MTDKPNKSMVELAAATRAVAQSAKDRVDAGKPLPATQTRELATATMALADSFEVYMGGRPATDATSLDGQLVTDACVALGTAGKPLPRKELAARLGFGSGGDGLVSPKRLTERPLSEERRAMLRAWIAGTK